MKLQSTAELNLRTLRPLIRWLEQHHGLDTLERVAHRMQIDVDALRMANTWVSIAAAETIHQTVFDLAGQNESVFRQVVGQGLADAYGPMRYVLRAASPKSVYLRAMRTIHLVSRVSRYQVVGEGPNWLRAHYESEQPESRLLCLSRQGNIAAMTTLWGLPPAHITEYACIGRGDDHCDYRVSWRPGARLLPAAIGAVLGGLTALAVAAAGGVWSWTHLSWLAVGAAFGQLLEAHRYHRTQVALEEQSHDALRQLASEEGAARRELIGLHQRQSEWLQLVEAEMNSRSATLEELVEQLRELQRERVTAIRGFSHDLNNPLGVMRHVVDFIKEDLSADDLPPELLREYVDDLDGAARQLEHRLAKMMSFVVTESHHEQVVLSRVELAPLADQLRRRLRALLIGRPVAVTVFSTREAPEALQTDRLIFDRVLDNLLSNAAKYTEEGSIVVEISGAPASLLVKISDTGRGIAGEEIEKIFLPGGSRPEDRAAHSYGLGLSVVVRLLDRIGGRLEVLSKPDIGTTFWVYVPVEHAETQQTRADDDVIARVVRIRRSHNE